MGAEIITTGLSSKITLLNISSSIVFNSPVRAFCGFFDAHSSGEAPFQGDLLKLSNARIEISSVKGLLSGYLDPAKKGSLDLLAGDSFWGDSGCLLSSISATGNPVILAGWVDFSSPLILKSSETTLFLSLENNILSDISLNGGTLALLRDTTFNKAFFINGPGIVSLGGQVLSFALGARIISSPLIIVGSGDLVLNDALRLSSSLTFSALDLLKNKFHIKGQGNILDLSFGGTLSVPRGSVLTIQDTSIKGLGAGSIVAEDGAAINFVGCTIFLSSDYTFSCGNITFIGENSTMVVGDKVCSFDGSCLLVVDGVFLYYDPLSALNANGITVFDPDRISAVRGAGVLSINKKYSDLGLVFDDTSNVCSGRFDISSDNKLFFRGLFTENLTIDGSDLFLNSVNIAAGEVSAQIVVPENKTAILRNCVINNFQPESISLGRNASLSFGDNVELVVTKKIALTSHMRIAGNVTMYGCSDILDLSAVGSFVISDGATLVLQDFVINGLGNNAGKFILEGNSSSVIFKNVTIVLSDDYDHSLGVFKFQGSDSCILTANKKISFKLRGKCVIDGVTLFYDSLSYPDMGNINPMIPDGTSLVFVRGGSISVIHDVLSSGSLSLIDDIYDLQRNEALSVAKKLSFNGASDSCVINGGGFSLSFPFSSEKVICVGDRKSIEFKNIVLKDFYWESIDFGRDSRVSFGDGVFIQLSQELLVSKSLFITGKVVIDLSGHSLNFVDSAQFILAPNAELSLYNGKILDISNVQAPFNIANNATIILHEIECNLSDDFSIAEGNCVIEGNVWISTRQHNFLFSSPNSFVIKKQSTLFLDSDSTFSFSSENKQFIFEDKSSVLSLRNSTFSVGLPGLFLQKGTLKVEGICVLDGGNGPGAQGLVVENQSFDVFVDYKASLDLKGLITNR